MEDVTALMQQLQLLLARHQEAKQRESALGEQAAQARQEADALVAAQQQGLDNDEQAKLALDTVNERAAQLERELVEARTSVTLLRNEACSEGDRFERLLKARDEAKTQTPQERERNRRKQLQEAGLSIHARSVVEDGLPPMVPPSKNHTQISDTLARHKPARARTAAFGTIRGIDEQLRARRGTYGTWLTTSTPTDDRPPALHQCYSAYGIARHISMALHDVESALPANLYFHNWEERSMFGDDDNVYAIINDVVYSFAVVVMPGGSIMDHELAHGTMYDCVQRLRHLHGVDHAFAILTSYSEWRVFWLPDNDNVAASTEMPSAIDKDSPPRIDRNLCPQTPSFDDDDDDGDEQEEDDDGDERPHLVPAERVISCSDTWKASDPDIVHKLASALLKTIHSPRSLQMVRPSKHHYLRVDATSSVWVTAADPDGEVALRLRYWPMPPPSAGTFLLLLYLGMGTFGRVWLATTASGAVCVLKFPMSNVDNDFDKEAAAWRDIWGIGRARALTLVQKKALLLPYVRMCSQEERQTSVVQAAAREAIQRMVMRGWQHDDLHWEHVGLYTRRGEIKALFVDLASVKPVSDPQAAANNMLAKLELL